jgi:hypothetical protein
MVNKLTIISLMGIAILGVFFPLNFVMAQSAPFANSLAADFIAEQSAKFNGRVNPGGMPDTQYWFEWTFAGREEWYTTKKMSMGSFPQNVSHSIIGLAPNTTYCFRVVAENSRGKDTGQLSCFTTKKLQDSIIPESRAMTIGTKSVLATSATLRGYVAPHTSTATYWFEYGSTPALGQLTRSATLTGASNYVEMTVVGLKPETTYYYRIVSESAGKRWNGEVLSFRTPTGSASSLSSLGGGSAGSAGGVASQTPIRPYSMRADRVLPSDRDVVVYFQWDLSGGVPYDIRSRGEFLVEYGPTKALTGGTVVDNTPRALVNGSTVRIPNYPGGVYFRGYYHGPTVQFRGPIEYAAAPKPEDKSAPTSGGTFTATTTGSTTTKEGGAIGTTTLPGSGASIPNPFGKLFGEKSSGAGSNDRLLGLFGKNQGSPKDEVTLLQSTTGSKKPQEPIEYTIRYANETKKVMTDAVLRVAFPTNVIYIGDNTNNELLVEENAKTGERVYVLPIGILKPGDARTITMMGMMTSDTATNPAVRSWISYTNPETGEKIILGDTVRREDIGRHEKGEDISDSGATKDERGFFARFFGDDEGELRDEATILHSTSGTGENGDPIVYTIRYANQTGKTMTDAKLRFTLPNGIEYAGDDTNGELTVTKDPVIGEKIYTLPIGTLHPGEGRTITVTGKKTGDGSIEGKIMTEVIYTDADGNTTTVRGKEATIEEIRKNEEETPIAATLAQKRKSENKGWRVFPTTILGWVILIAILTLLIVGWNKGYAWYLKKKKEIEEQEKLWNEQRA